MNEVRFVEITAEEEGQRLDNFLLKILKGVPKSHIYRIIRNGEVRVNKKRADVSYRILVSDLIRIPPVRVSSEKNVFIGSKLEDKLTKCILHEDNELLILNKPAGLAVHGGSGLSLGVIEALRKMRSDLAYLELVHRLDKDTSGCLVLAKKRSALRALHAQFSTREVHKLYWALLKNPWTGKKQTLVEAPLLKNILKSGERFVTTNEEGKPSQTLFKLLENYELACLVEASPKTGRTHQIRVHSAFLQHPIIGDSKYGGEKTGIGNDSRLYLHARAIQFTLNDKQYSFKAELDEQFKQMLKKLRLQGGEIHE